MPHLKTRIKLLLKDEMRLRMKDFNIKDLLDGKLFAKLFHKVT